jgi:hypothetical protein
MHPRKKSRENVLYGMIHHCLLFCSLSLLLASCGRAPEDDEERGGSLRLERTDDYLRIMNGDQAVLNYWLTPQLPSGLPEHYTRSGFIHPVWSPSGKVVTDNFPVGYAHQHGFFTAWTNTTFRDSLVDFWNTHKGLATVMHKKVEEIVEQDGIIGFEAKIVHRSNVHGGNEPVLVEELIIRVHDRNDVFVWDVRSEQTNVTKDTLFLYGGLGIRGSKYWNAKDTTNFMGRADFLTSDGLTRDSANHTRPEWTAIYGDLPGGKAGMAVVTHPENFRWPAPVRVHPDLPYFSVSPVTEAGFFIEPGETYLARYKVVVFDGEVPINLLDE